jgi:hypothetical protein
MALTIDSRLTLDNGIAMPRFGPHPDQFGK